MKILTKKIIGVDLDDVLLNFNDGLMEYLNERYGTSKRRVDMFSFDLEDIWNVPRKEIIEEIEKYYHMEEHLGSPPIEGAIEAIDKLSETYLLYIITAKPESLRTITEQWLNKHFSDHFEDVHFAHHALDHKRRSKAEICNELNVDILIDDSMKNALNVAGAGIQVLLLDAPWNQGEVISPITRVASWEAIVNKLLP